MNNTNVNKTAIITGSSKGLGKALAIELSKKRFNIILHGRDIKSLTEIDKVVKKNKVKCDVVIGDITEEDTISKLIGVARLRNASILINNAAIMSKGTLEEIKDDEIEDVLSTNLSAVIKLTKGIYKLFLKNKEKNKGTIININSTGGLRPDKRNVIYSASKYGLKGFTDCLRLGAKENGVRVLGIYPGGMHTTFHERTGGHPQIDLTMDTKEVAEIICNLIGYNTVHIDEIILDRMYRE